MYTLHPVFRFASGLNLRVSFHGTGLKPSHVAQLGVKCPNHYQTRRNYLTAHQVRYFRPPIRSPPYFRTFWVNHIVSGCACEHERVIRNTICGCGVWLHACKPHSQQVGSLQQHMTATEAICFVLRVTAGSCRRNSGSLSSIRSRQPLRTQHNGG